MVRWRLCIFRGTQTDPPKPRPLSPSWFLKGNLGVSLTFLILQLPAINRSPNKTLEFAALLFILHFSLPAKLSQCPHIAPRPSEREDGASDEDGLLSRVAKNRQGSFNLTPSRPASRAAPAYFPWEKGEGRKYVLWWKVVAPQPG